MPHLSNTFGSCIQLPWLSLSHTRLPEQNRFLLQILDKERPDAILPTMGGQTGLNIAKALAESGILEKYNVELIGAKLPSIDRAEDRDLFKQVIRHLTCCSIRTPSAIVYPRELNLHVLATPASYHTGHPSPAPNATQARAASTREASILGVPGDPVPLRVLTWRSVQPLTAAKALCTPPAPHACCPGLPRAERASVPAGDGQARAEDGCVQDGQHSGGGEEIAENLIRKYPIIIRPAFTLGGTGGGIAYNQDELVEIVTSGIDASMTGQVLPCVFSRC